MSPQEMSENLKHREGITNEVIRILEDMTSDWDLEFSGGIAPDTFIISNLQFESIDVVQFVIQIEEALGRKDLPFEKLLMIDGRYRDDMKVQEVADFLYEHL